MKTLKQMNQDIMVVTSTYVMNDNMPILYVSCDEDSENVYDGYLLQFHSGNGDYSMDKMLLVKLGNILKKDNTLNDLVLEIGDQVERTSVNYNWIKTVQ